MCFGSRFYSQYPDALSYVSFLAGTVITPLFRSKSMFVGHFGPTAPTLDQFVPFLSIQTYGTLHLVLYAFVGVIKYMMFRLAQSLGLH